MRLCLTVAFLASHAIISTAQQPHHPTLPLTTMPHHPR
jgi:hypothetical protein